MDHNFRKVKLPKDGGFRLPSRNKAIVKLLIILIFVSCAAGVILMWSLYSSPSSITTVVRNVFPSSRIKSRDNKVNVLLLGNAGGRHDGPLLTDTIIVASYNLKTDNVLLISIPRDLWIGELNAKVNTAYEKGVKKDDGLRFAEERIGSALSLPIHYGVRIDFSGFEKAVDTISGVEVEVPKTFDDYNYPIEGKENDICDNREQEIEVNDEMARTLNVQPGKKKLILTPSGKVATQSADFACRFERISFKKGIVKMDGETALKFVRSRMGTNGEGSDFARSRRQQLVIQAFKDKILSTETLFDLGKITSLIETFGQSLETDIPKDKFLDFYGLFKKMQKINTVVLGNLGEGKSLFVNPPPSEYGGAWVLVPPEEDWSQVADFVRKALEEEQ